MEEQKLEEIQSGTPMSEEEFRENLKKKREAFEEEVRKGTLFLRDYTCTRVFKSVRRAIRKGKMSIWGDIYPKRPFNNRANTCKRKGKHSRVINELKKQAYVQLRAAELEQD